jgi:hypothetical protein
MAGHKWIWSREDPNQSSISGDITRLFRAEGTDQPGVLSRESPPDRALLFAREAIQNSWDAARELRNRPSGAKLDPFLLRINFREFAGNSKSEIVKALALEQLAARANSKSGTTRAIRDELGLFPTDCLSVLEETDVPLSVMYFEENGSMGMPGNWEKSESRMMFALNRVGYNKKMEGSGGSYGYGKAGLIQASRIRVVFAYSCFEEDSSDPGVTRRLLGAAYWGQHAFSDNKYTGWVRLGKPVADSAKPLENESADEFAELVGLKARSSKKTKDLGTTFVIVDPDIDPYELKSAIERNWWPSLVDDAGLRVQISLSNGTRIDPVAPVSDPDLGPFVAAYSLALKSADETNENSRSRNLGSYRPQDIGTNLALGRLALVADPDEWTFPVPDYVDTIDGQVPHQSMVALVRGPRMVVQYWTPRGSKPYVRGVFIAGDDVDDFLRQTEPKAHDKWDPRLNEPGIHPAATKIASEVLKRLASQVQEFRDSFRIPPPPTGPVNLPTLNSLMQLLSGGTPPPPPKDPRPFKMSFTRPPRIEPKPAGQVAMKATAAFSLADIVDEDTHIVDLFIEVTYVEDSRSGSSVKLSIEPPAGFSLVDVSKGKYRYRGELSKDGPRFEFAIETVPYSADWSTKLAISGELVK